MSLQLLIIPFIVIAFVAIVWRFLPRAADGSVRLPRLIDDSVGMWFVRSALGRETDPADPDDLTLPEPAADEIAYRIGVPGAPPPTTPLLSPARGAIASNSPRAADGPVGRRRTRRPSGALAAQRRWAGAVALLAVIVAVTALALKSRQLDGEVLSATGTPAGSVGQGLVTGEGDSTTDTPAAPTDPGLSSQPPSTELPSQATPGAPAGTVGPAATTRVPTAPAPVANVTPSPTRTPRPTARPTPVPTLRPDPSPSTAPSATPTPTPAPTPSPEPSPSPSP